MKKLLSLLMCGLLLFGCSDQDNALRDDLNDLELRVENLEELCKQMNTNISSLQKIVEALQHNLTITEVQERYNGYVIHFSDGSTATIKHGMDSGPTPVVGVKKDTDGIYYWTLDDEWLTDVQGNKVKAQGTDGEDGKNGQDGLAPRLKIENGRWMLSTNDGKTWTDIGQATGEDGADGKNSIFKNITEDKDNVYFTLEDDSVITIPKGDKSEFAIAFDTTDIAVLEAGERKTISYTITAASENTVVKTIAQDGWKAQVNATSADKGTITVTAPDPIVESEILVFANDGSYRTVMASFHCREKRVMEINIADNSVDVSLAGGTQEIKVKTNLDYSIKIPDDAKSWLSLAPQTRAVREDTIVFAIAENNGIQRFATVILEDEKGNILQTIIFRQLGTSTEVFVETKGGLETVLADYDYAEIESLKISGVLNDVDFLFIYRMMPKLKNLDISDVNITSLPDLAFYKSTNVENLILPNTLTTIGEGVFYESGLKSVVIAPNVATIDVNAFMNCTSLTSIVIPASVETIEAAAFKGCTSLATVIFEKGLLLKTIGNSAFFQCAALTSIEIPASVETIGASAFSYSSSLATVTFEKGARLKTIADGAFSYCSVLTSIEIPARVETIGKSAFGGCPSLASVTFEKGSQLKTIGDEKSYSSTFRGCKITSIEIPASVETIGHSAFDGCRYLKTVTFEKGSLLKTLGSSIFSECTAFTSIEIPAGVETIGSWAFSDCFSLATVTFEKGSRLNTIKNATFFNCSVLTSIEIPASVETIEYSAFEGCRRLKTVTFENGSLLKTIGGGYNPSSYDYYGAFLNCSALTSIIIPAGVETIETTVFQGCSSLTTVTFEKGSRLKYIEGGYYVDYSTYSRVCLGAFSTLPKLMTVDMSECSLVEYIGEFAFYHTKSLQLFKIGTAVPPTCDERAFDEINPYSVLKVPSGSIDAYKSDEGWSIFMSVTGLDE